MTILVIGGGQAAASFAAKYRALGGDAPVTILGDEPHYPYQRPPLSKKYLSGEMELERLYLRPANWYEDNNVTFRANARAQSIDRAAKTVILKTGEMLGYETLILATGSRPRMLPEAMTQSAAGIYAVRSLAHVDAMKSEFVEGRKLLVVGGGYIGLEAAAIARKFGVEVTLVEAAPRILGRVASEATADFIRAKHVGQGVDIREGVGLDGFIVKDGRVAGVTLADGSSIDIDFAIIGIGIQTNSEIAEDAGIHCEQGILVDKFCRSNDPNIYAAGDCARIEHNGERIRIESVGNAIDQAETIAATLAGEETRYEPKPWFWSDQYDMTLQIAGLNMGYDDTVSRAGAKDGAMSVWYYRGDQLIAVDAMSDPRAYMMGKRIIEAGKTLPKSVVADPNSNLKDYM